MRKRLKHIIFLLVTLVLLSGCTVHLDAQRVVITQSDYSFSGGWYITTNKGDVYEVDSNIRNMALKDHILGAEVYLRIRDGYVEYIRIIE